MGIAVSRQIGQLGGGEAEVVCTNPYTNDLVVGIDGVEGRLEHRLDRMPRKRLLLPDSPISQTPPFQRSLQNTLYAKITDRGPTGFPARDRPGLGDAHDYLPQLSSQPVTRMMRPVTKRE